MTAAAPRRSLPLVPQSDPAGGPRLEDVRIASPCSVSWDDMVGDDVVRFCGHCEKNVYNLSAMKRENAEAFLAQNDATGTPACVRLYQRADGTVMTADCPVGVRRRRRRRTLAAVGATFLAATASAAAGGLAGGEPMQGGIRPVTMGAVAIPAGTTPSSVETVAPVDTGSPRPAHVDPVVHPPHVMGRWISGAPPMPQRPAHPDEAL